MTSTLSELEMICLIILLSNNDPIDFDRLRFDTELWLNGSVAGPSLTAAVRSIIAGPMEVINACYSG